MSPWYVLSKREARQTLRGKGIWVVPILALLLAIPTKSGVEYTYSDETTPLVLAELGGDATLALVQNSLALTILVAGLGLSYGRIAGECDRGSFQFTAALTASRTGIVVGKIVGITSVLLLALALPVAGWLVGGILWYGAPAVGTTVAFFGVTALYATTVVSIGIGISALARRRSIAAGLGFLLFVFTLFSDIVARSLYDLTSGTAGEGAGPPDAAWPYLLQRLMPTDVYFVVTNWVLSVPNTTSRATTAVHDLHPNIFTNAVLVDSLFASPPFYLEQWFGVLLLVGWGLAVPAAGVVALKRGDLW